MIIVKVCRIPSLPSSLLLGFNSATRLLSAPLSCGTWRLQNFGICRTQSKMPLGGASELYRSFYACWIKALQFLKCFCQILRGRQVSRPSPQTAELASPGPWGATEYCCLRVTWGHLKLCCIWPCPNCIVGNAHTHPICLRLQHMKAGQARI